MQVHVLIVGQVDDPEFAGVGDFLGVLRDVTIEQVHGIADSLGRAPHTSDAAQPPDLIVVLERHPDEHPPREIRRLIETHPLARIVCGYGPWSESAARTRGAWPPIAWTPISLLREHVLSELAVIRGARRGRAITSDRADAFEQSSSEGPAEQPTLASLQVAVDVPDREYRAMLEDELNLHSARLVGITEDWDLLLFDAHPEEYRLRELRKLLNSRPASTGRIIVLHEMPQAAARATWSSEQLQTPLTVHVVSKLAPLAGLLALLQPGLGADATTNWPSDNDSATS